jgi:FkbM family methyltransferase
LFSILFNLRNKARSSVLRVKYLRGIDIFRVSDGITVRFGSVNSRVLNYLDGFEARASYIGDTYMLSEVPLEAGNLVVDCGANMGDLEYFLRQNYSGVRYIGYEPNPLDFFCLKHNAGADNVRNIGLWNEVGSIPFYVNDAFASSSFIEPPEYTEIIEIPASTLSDQFPNEKIRLLKLEAEGAEPEVLEGASKILPNIDYISADVGPERGVNEEETRDFVVNFLTQSGFELISERKLHRKIVLFKRCGAL